MENTRQKIINEIYEKADEDSRLVKNRQGQLEYFMTMDRLRHFLKGSDRIIEIGAGTGRYSVALAKEGYDVTAVELADKNLEVLKEKGKDLNNLHCFKGDATDLSRFKDNSFDVTLVLGPLYHLYEPSDIDLAIDEAVRITSKGGIIFFAFLSIYAIMAADYFHGNWIRGEEFNYTADHQVRHFKEQLFTGFDIAEFEQLFEKKDVRHLTTVGTDFMLETLQKDPDFALSDEDFERFCKWYTKMAEKRELLGCSSHLLYICQKQ